MINTVKNSWHYIKPMNECQHLLSEDMSQYDAHFFHCLCGYEDVVLSLHYQTPTYNCPICKNVQFIYGFNAQKSSFLENEPLVLEYACRQNDQSFKAEAYLDVPIGADYMRKCMTFNKRVLFSYAIYYDGNEEKETYLRAPVFIQSVMKEQLHFTIFNSFKRAQPLLHQKRPWLISKKRITEILFYLDNPQCLDSAYFYWKRYKELRSISRTKPILKVEQALGYLINNRKERSIKRALFEEYEKWKVGFISHQHIYTHIPEEHHYDTLAPFIISRCIDDPNLVVKLLRKSLSLAFKTHLNSSMNGQVLFSDDISRNAYGIKDIIWFILFLKKTYSEKEIVKYLLQIELYSSVWRDTLLFVPGYKHAMKKYFKKVKLTVPNIHDEIVKCAHYIENKVLDTTIFLYEEYEYESTICLEGGLEFVLPRTGLMLREWGYTLQNCLEGYIDPIHKRHTTVYGVFKDGHLTYAIEIVDREIVQMSGKHNSYISSALDIDIILEWEAKYFSTVVHESFEDVQSSLLC